jgi:putative IMPACT (imprinted ancient) family translation regulator
MIENIKTIQKVDKNILEFIELAVSQDKLQKLEEFMKDNNVWGKEKYLVHHTGTRENTEENVYLFQIGFEGHQEDLWFVVEEEELK